VGQSFHRARLPDSNRVGREFSPLVFGRRKKVRPPRFELAEAFLLASLRGL
jgi:hypothetical protein